MPDLRRAPVFRTGSLQFDPTSRNGDTQNAYQNARRREHAARTASNYPAPGPRPRPRTRDGYPVQVRNGLPVRFRAVTDTKACGCVRRLNMAVMDWELTDPCGGPLCLS
jgi:hypothetical protein